ncbi:MAG: OmpA family protein [Melioribacteraceae bacterium]|nr:OmpA family protein [Melioribacteraceae bacterium]MCF8355179.1 OmpA family protein [Melioribacteraceae bacterium]MCF8395392.1 OmpA family protein [Melioribacteraceae bacterium]MCF8419902.1 OmpA family protein [Melioribacteraceae bacterium]
MKHLKYVLLFSAILSSFTLSQQEIRERLFKEADEALVKMEEVNAVMLSPNFYEEGLEYYRDAESALKDGESLDDIREQLSEAVKLFNKAFETSKISGKMFEELLKARSDAVSSNAEIHASEIWIKAEKTFRDAAEEVEYNELKDAEELAFEAEKLFREAELASIKAHYLNETWELHKQAIEEDVDDYAPLTLQKSKELIDAAEKELNDNRYDTDYARDLAKEAHSQVNHAISLTRLFKEWDENDKTSEELVLYYEEPLIQIASKLDLTAKFDSGYSVLASQIISKLNLLYAEIDDLKQKNSNLENQVDEYEKELGGITEEKSELKQRLAVIDDLKRRFEEVANSFSPSEAVVLRDADKLTIRLVSIKFDAGKAIIAPEHFNLLAKVKNALEKFPDAIITVEGHTDSYGSDKTNLDVSQSRADAVYQYLIANLNISKSKIFSIGYGESKPVANNETAEGREKNRRIDIVIRPAKI